MSAIANIVVSDGTGNKTFIPAQTSPAVYRDVSDATLPESGQPSIEVTVFRAKGNGAHRVRVTTKVPAMETPAGGTTGGYTAAPAVAYSILAVTDFYVPQRSSAAQRLALRNLHRNLMNDTQTVDAVEKLIAPY